jgi:membrane associated rhomboid family serine protease
MSKHTIVEELKIMLGFVGVIWGVYVLECIFPGLMNFGLIPREPRGLIGILTMPFLHGSFGHLLSNTIPLVVLLALMAGSRTNSLKTIVEIAILGGVLLWLFGRSSVHVGASGLIYGLSAFLICAGIFEKRLGAIAVAALVFLVFGTSLMWGLLPSFTRNVSWEGHALGAVAGVLVAFWQSKKLTDDRKSLVGTDV